MVSAPGGSDAAGEDPRRLAGADTAVERMPGRDFADHLELGRHCRDVVARARRSRPWRRRRRAAACAWRRDRRRARGRARSCSVAASAGSGIAPSSTRRERLCDRHQRCHSFTPSPIAAGLAAATSRSGGCLRCACRARPPSPCRRWSGRRPTPRSSASISTPVWPVTLTVARTTRPGSRWSGCDVDRDLGDGQRMTERDQLVRLLGRHDAGDAGGAEHVALLGVAFEHEVERLHRHHHAALGDRLALGRRLGRRRRPCGRRRPCRDG